GRLAFSGNKIDAFNYFNKNYLDNKDDNFFQGKVAEVNKKYNLTKINMKKHSIMVFSKDFKKEEDVLVRISATDLIVCKNLPKKISTLNYLHLELREIRINSNLVFLYFKFNSNLLKAHITKISFESLKLKKGEWYYILVKAININEIMSFNLA
ncbi:TOBE domain-containing protein, partial [Alphaproteobacteria bacterium]|nr:TOBE domain-containing protein [Alphaproteobacteria bacterium]